MAPEVLAVTAGCSPTRAYLGMPALPPAAVLRESWVPGQYNRPAAGVAPRYSTDLAPETSYAASTSSRAARGCPSVVTDLAPGSWSLSGSAESHNVRASSAAAVARVQGCFLRRAADSTLELPGFCRALPSAPAALALRMAPTLIPTVSGRVSPPFRVPRPR